VNEKYLNDKSVIEDGTEDDTSLSSEYESGTTGQLEEDYKGFVFSQEGLLCNLQEKAGIPSRWILLDS